MEILFCSHPSCTEVIAIKIWTWYNNYALLACLKIYNDMTRYDGVTIKLIFPSNVNYHGKNLSWNGPRAIIVAYAVFTPTSTNMPLLLVVDTLCPTAIFLNNHDDVIKWKHFPRYWSFVRGIHRSPVNFAHKGQWRGALMFFLICVWINVWVNNGEAGDLRRHRGHCDVTVMNYYDTEKL